MVSKLPHVFQIPVDEIACPCPTLVELQMCCIGCSNIFYGPFLLMVHKKNTSVNEVWSNRILWKICWFLTWFINFLNKFVFIDLPLIQNMNKFIVRKWAGNITTDHSHHGHNLFSSFPLVGATEHCMPTQVDNCTFFPPTGYTYDTKCLCSKSTISTDESNNAF